MWVAALFLVGCAQQRPGFAIVNHSDQTLKDVKIRTERPGHDPMTASTQGMEPGSYFAGTAIVGMLGDRCVASWVDSNGPRRQEFASKVPSGFDGYACFEFTTGGWRLVPVKRTEIDAFLNGRTR